MGVVTVRVRLFAILRERAGSDSIEVELTDGATVADALAALSEHAALSTVLEQHARPDGGQPDLRVPRRPGSAPATSWR